MKYGTAGGNVKVRAVNACGNSSYRDLAVVINCREGMTGIDIDQDIFIYPNPSSKDITIEWKSNSSETTTLEIMDLTGRTIHKESINRTTETKTHSMDIAAFQNGVYLLRLSNDKQTAVFKVVKQ
jgi:hypothetical protein